MSKVAEFRRNAVMIAIGVAVGVVIGAVVSPATGAVAIDALTITTCRIDQSLFRVQVSQQGATATLVSGDASLRVQTKNVLVGGVDTNGNATNTQGAVEPGYAGVGFKALLPVGKSSLRTITICFR